jgi:rubrerythrin
MEFQEMYPKFVAEAEAEGNQPAAMAFADAMAVERIHHGLYSEALKALRAGGDLKEARMYVCPVCGNTVIGGAPDECPICGTPKSKFFEVK